MINGNALVYAYEYLAGSEVPPLTRYRDAPRTSVSDTKRYITEDSRTGPAPGVPLKGPLPTASTLNQPESENEEVELSDDLFDLGGDSGIEDEELGDDVPSSNNSHRDNLENIRAIINENLKKYRGALEKLRSESKIDNFNNNPKAV